MQDEGPAGARGETGLSTSVLVLNRNYSAIRIIPARRAFSLMYKDYAECVEVDNGDYLALDFRAWLEYSETRSLCPHDHEQYVRTPKRVLLVPRIIRLTRFDKVPRRGVRFNRRNVMARDGHVCQYCAKRLPSSRLSLDHVVPRSRGGRSGWKNVVTACKPCNTRKGGNLLGDTRMRLLRPPQVPKTSPLLRTKLKSKRYSIWRHFLGNGDIAVDAG